MKCHLVFETKSEVCHNIASQEQNVVGVITYEPSILWNNIVYQYIGKTWMNNKALVSVAILGMSWCHHISHSNSQFRNQYNNSNYS